MTGMPRFSNFFAWILDCPLTPISDDLHFPANGYAIMLSVFYVPFCVLVVPGVMLTRKIGPRWTIPGYMMGWGAMAMIAAAAKSFASQLVVRLCTFSGELLNSPLYLTL